MPNWYRPLKKTLYTLRINDYSPAVCELTFPLLRHYAKKIGADFHVITERKFPDCPVVYEKLQIYELGREHGNDWNLFLDADTLVNPEMIDVTAHLAKDTVAHNGKDVNTIRWSQDQYFLRDGRRWGSCNWCSIASDWCLDLWRPLDDLTLEEAKERIHITVAEANSGCCQTEHLIDDFTLSRNIARFGLKATTITEICQGLGWKDPQGRGVSPHLFHLYTLPEDVKLQKMLEVLTKPQEQGGWALMGLDQAAEFRRKWGLQ